MRADEAERGYDIKALKMKKSFKRKGSPAKGKYKVRCHTHVWCDHHGSIHPAEIDYYDESGYRLDGTPTECNPDNWRRVYVATSDKNEEF